MSMTNSFNLNDHIGTTHEFVSIFDKIDYSGKINLSSNQLEHEGLLILFQNFIKNFDFALTCQYLFSKSIASEAANFYNLLPGQLFFCAGSDIAITHIIKTIPKKAVILQTPNYTAYKDQANLNSIPVIEVNFLNKTQEEHVNDMIQAIQLNGPALAVISNPNNSLGTCLSLTSIIKIVKICLENNTILLLDEAYCSFADFNHLSLLQSYPNVIIIRTYSKSHGMAGLRLGSVMAHENIICFLKKTGLEKTVSTISLHYYKYLMQHNEDIIRIRNEIISEKILFTQWINYHFPAWFTYPSSTNFLTIQVGSEIEASSIVKYLLNNDIVIKQLNFKEISESLIRISIGSKSIMHKLKMHLKNI